jgi:uncharacterized damage-inducible protein DinB
LSQDMLRDMYAHQAWADAEHWRAAAATPGALEDAFVGDRFHHILMVQRAFLALVWGEAPRLTHLADYPSMQELRKDAMAYHASVAEVLAQMTPAKLEETIAIPWFQDPDAGQLRVTVEQALTQCATHSHYHRGQNATRLRELGGEPPLTDIIVWWWKRRPAPVW